MRSRLYGASGRNAPEPPLPRLERTQCLGQLQRTEVRPA
ncbi:MAG: hypothetical protein RLZ98_1344, partial [Pseudomonadota bacterium]